MRGWQHRRTARTDRWKRENDATRLKDEVPNLESLRMSLEEHSGGHMVLGTSRVQHVVVPQASSRFEIPCGDGKCEEGGHDLSEQILARLRQRRDTFEGESVCNGRVGERSCERLLKFSAQAKYAS